MTRYHMHNKNHTHFVEYPFNSLGLSQIKAFRRGHPKFKGQHIRVTIQLIPSIIPVGDIIEYK